MSTSQPIKTIPDLAQFGNVVPEGYLYYDKLIRPGADLSLPNACLKWYELYPADAEITPEQDAECRAFFTAEVARLNLQQELGFVIIHRAGSVLLPMLMTWRNTNEIWESVYVKHIGQPGGCELMTFPGTHRGTYCVWELTIVWHERNAWMRFLSSKRDEAAKLAYLNDRFTGRT